MSALSESEDLLLCIDFVMCSVRLSWQDSIIVKSDERIG